MKDRKLEHLHPDIEPPCRQLMAQCELEGIPAFVVFTWRSANEQNLLYAQGRTLPGKIVTNATAEKSKHCFTINGEPASKAFDVAISDGKGGIIANGDHPLFKRVGEIGESLDLIWGGRWKSIQDASHFEVP